MSSFWCEQAIIDGTSHGSVRVETSKGVITAVKPGSALSDSDIRLPGLTLPGLANGHSHAFHRALRGRTHADGGTFWSWRERMYAVAARLDPDTYFELATAVFAEMVLAGYTLVGEFHYVHHRPDGRQYDNSTAMEDAVIAAAARAGIRLTLLDTLYLAGGLDAAGASVPLGREQLRFSDGSVAAWSARRGRIEETSTAKVGAAIHSLRAVPVSELAAVRAATRGIPLHAHVSEQLAENNQVMATHGVTPTELFADAGLLGPDFTAVHGTHLSDHDIATLGDTRSSVCFCPTTERDLADGIGPATALASAGARISLGSDQNAIIDPFEELRGLEMDARLASGERGRFTPAQLLTSATRSGYESLGWSGGSIRVGASCDLVAVNTRSPRTAGAALGQLWLAATASDVTDVVVGGELVVGSGSHTLGDVGALLESAFERIA